MYTYIKLDRDLPDVSFVESWWDKMSRSWVTQLKNANLEQVGDCAYSGNRIDARHAHRTMVETVVGETIPYICENISKNCF